MLHRERNIRQAFLRTKDPIPAAYTAISFRRAKASGRARPYASRPSATQRQAPVPVRLYWLRLSASLASAVAPVVHAAATSEASSGCVTHTSITTGRPGKSASKSSRWGSHWLCGGSRGACVLH